MPGAQRPRRARPTSSGSHGRRGLGDIPACERIEKLAYCGHDRLGFRLGEIARLPPSAAAAGVWNKTTGTPQAMLQGRKVERVLAAMRRRKMSAHGRKSASVDRLCDDLDVM